MMSATLSADRKQAANGFLSMFLWSIKKHKSLLIVYSVLLLFSCPIIMLITGVSQLTNNTYVDLAMVSVGTFAVLTTMCALFMTLLVAPMMFDYLHNKRKSDLYGAMPCSRRTLFFSRYLAGLAIIVVPYILNMLIVVLSDICVGISYAGVADVNFVKGYDAIFTISLIIVTAIIAAYSFTSFIALCCGTTANTILCTLLINISYPIAVVVFSVLFSGMIPGVSIQLGGNDFIVFLLSPYLTFISPLFESCRSYLTTPPYYDFIPSSYGMELAVAATITAAALIACFFLLKRRKAESAQGSFAFSAPATVIRFIASAGIGLIAAIIAGNMSFATGGSYVFDINNIGIIGGTDGSSYSVYSNFNPYRGFTTGDAWLIFLIFMVTFIITAFAVHLVATVIFNKGFKGFAKSLVGYGALVGVVGVVYLILGFGCFGADKYIPQNDEIASVDISCSNVSYVSALQSGSSAIYGDYNNFDNGCQNTHKITDKASIAMVTDLHGRVIENLSTYFPTPYHVCPSYEGLDTTHFDSEYSHLYSVDSTTESPNQNSFINPPNSIMLTYHLKNGGTVNRIYSSVYYIGIDMGQEISKIILSSSNNDFNKLEKAVNSDTIDITSFELRSIIHYGGGYYQSKYIPDKKICSALAEAIKADMKSGAASSNIELKTEEFLCSLYINYNNSETSKKESANIIIPITYTNSVRLLAQYGFLCEADVYSDKTFKIDENSEILFSLPDKDISKKPLGTRVQVADDYADSQSYITMEIYGELNGDSVFADAASGDSLYCRTVYLGSDGNLYYRNDMYSQNDKVDNLSSYEDGELLELTVDLPVLCDKKDPKTTYTPYIIQFYSKDKKLHTTPINVYNYNINEATSYCVMVSGYYERSENNGINAYTYLSVY